MNDLSAFIALFCFVIVVLFDLDGDGQIMTKDNPSLSQRCNIHDTKWWWSFCCGSCLP